MPFLIASGVSKIFQRAQTADLFVLPVTFSVFRYTLAGNTVKLGPGTFGTDNAARRSAIVYLLRLGAGWIIGMGACVLVLSKLFSAHIVQSDDRKEGGNMSPD